MRGADPLRAHPGLLCASSTQTSCLNQFRRRAYSSKGLSLRNRKDATSLREDSADGGGHRALVYNRALSSTTVGSDLAAGAPNDGERVGVADALAIDDVRDIPCRETV